MQSARFEEMELSEEENSGHVYDSMSPHGEVPPSISEMGQIFGGRPITRKQYDFIKGQYAITKNARPHNVVKAAVSTLPLSDQVKQRIMEMVEPQIEKYRKQSGLTLNQAVAYLVKQAASQVSMITTNEELQDLLSKSNLRLFKVKRVSFRIMTSDPSKVQILIDGRQYKGKKKLVKLHNNIYDLKLKPDLADVDKNGELNIRLVGATVAVSKGQFKAIGTMFDSSRVNVRVSSKRCFGLFKTEKRVSGTIDDKSRIQYREMKIANIMKKFNPSSNNYPMSRTLYDQSGHMIDLLREYKETYYRMIHEDHGKSPETIALNALMESDKKVFKNMNPTTKQNAVEFFRMAWIGRASKEDVNYVGIKGLLVPSEFDGTRRR
jgi:hypothetical protein